MTFKLDYILFAFIFMLFHQCAKTQSSVDKKSHYAQKMLSPVKVDDHVATFGFRSIIMGDLDKNFTKSPKQIRQYSNWYGDDIPKIIDGDTLYLHAIVDFNPSGLITKIETSEKKQHFYYDERGNLVLRNLYTENKGSSVDRISYDEHGNLLWYFQYKITEDSLYVFDRYKEYSYEKQGDYTVVTVKGLEKWSDFQRSDVIKTYDSNEMIQTIKEESYNPLNGIRMQTISKYTYETIEGEKYLHQEKISPPSLTSSHILKTYKHDELGRLIMSSNKSVNIYGYYEYRDSISYPDKYTEVKTNIYISTIPKEKRGYMSNEKEGKQSIFQITKDSLGNVIEHIETSPGYKGLVKTITTSDYIYDENMNWTSKSKKYEQKFEPVVHEEEMYDSDEDIEKYYREISYFSGSEKMANPPKFDEKAKVLKDSILSAHFEK